MVSRSVLSMFPSGQLDTCEYPRKIHDLEKDLYNPDPIRHWEPGDTLWFYNKRDGKAYYSVIKSVRDDDVNDRVHLFVCYIGDDDTSTVLLDAAEAFRSLEDLRNTFFNIKFK